VSVTHSKPMRFRSSQLGFTLIEIMVAITILALLFGTGMVAYLKFNDNQTVIVTGQQVQLMLRTAQKKARVGDKPSGCSILQGYQLTGSTVPYAVIQLDAVCGPSGATLVHSDAYTLPNKVTLQNAISIKFKVLTGGTDQPGNVVVTGSNGTTYTFAVGSGGDISEGVTQLGSN